MIKVDGRKHPTRLDTKEQLLKLELAYHLAEQIIVETKKRDYQRLLTRIGRAHQEWAQRGEPRFNYSQSIARAILHAKRSDLAKNPIGGNIMDEAQLSFKFEELVDFIERQRVAAQHFWWLAMFDPSNPSPLRVSTSCRGFFDDGYWMPIDDELCPECETAIATIRKSSKIYGMLDHCATRPHITAMLKRRTVEQLESEYQYMLEQIIETLAEKM